MNEDYIVTAMTSDGLFRCWRQVNLDCGRGRRRHKTSRTATAALGRVMTGAALMAATLDDDQSVTLRILADGPSGGIIAEAANAGKEVRVRGYMGDPDADLPPASEGKLDVGGLIGTDGYVHVLKDFGLGRPYTGSAKLQSGEIAIDLAYYYTVSEQLPTAMALGVRLGGTRAGSGRGRWVTAAGGLMVQVMPGRSPEESGDAIDSIQKNLAELGSISLRIQQGAEPEGLIQAALFGVADVEIMSRLNLTFSCRCSRERAEATLMGLGKQDLRNLSGEQEVTDVRCPFCNESYSFSSRELIEIAEKAPDRSAKETP